MPARAQTKGERTRDNIVARSAPLFNQRGFAGASMADLLAATGLTAGGVYRHFEGKEALAVAAFDHAVALHAAHYRSAVARASGAAERIAALAAAMASIVESPLVAGGCPLMNTAIETDDAYPALPTLRRRARRAMAALIQYARGILADGVASGELEAGTDADAEARAAIATMEGAIMLAKLFEDPSYTRQAAAHVAARARALTRGTTVARRDRPRATPHARTTPDE